MIYKFSCITIGNEILSGFRVDTDFYHLVKKLGEIGYSCALHLTVPDSGEMIKKALDICLKETDIVFTIGGLGPTSDDLTRESISIFLRTELEFRKDIFDGLKKKEPLLSEEKHKKYGLFPRGAKIYENEVGLAHAFMVSKENKKIFSLPGPKNEFEHTLNKIINELEKFEDYSVLYFDLPFKKEIEIEERLKEKVNIENLFFLPYTGGVVLGLKGKKSEVEKFKDLILEKFGEEISSEGPEPLEKVIGDLLRNKKMTLSTAESCTGGLLSSRITDIPGSSDYFIGGVVAYSNEIKKKILGVKEEDLKNFGAVSEPVVKQMADGIRELFNTDFGIGISGIAGPAGGTPQKPVGTVYLSLSFKERTQIYREFFTGSRKDIKFKSSHFILNELRKTLLKL